MTQLSLLPEEVPDQFIPVRRKRPKSLRRKIRKMIRNEGLYNYALAALEILNSTDEYIETRYKLNREELKTLLYSEFGEACGYQEDIECFIANVKNIPGFAINKCI